MAWLHTWVGLWFSWLLFAVFLTGSLAVFSEPISHWMNPEHQAAEALAAQQESTPIDRARRLDLAVDFMARNHAGAGMWEIWPADRYHDNGLTAYWFDKNGQYADAELDPVTGAELDEHHEAEGRATRGGSHFVDFHYTLHDAGLGLWIVAFATMAMLPERAKAVQFSKPYVANTIVLIGPKKDKITTNADMAKYTIGVAKGAAQDTQVTKNAPSGTTIRRYDGDAPSIQALVSGQVQALGGNIFYMQRIEQGRPGEFENKLEFQNLYNGACTRLGEKEINAAINTFIDKIKANGELQKVYDKWMKVPVHKFPDSLEGISFTAS